MASTSRYSTASAFLETCSTQDIVTHTVSTSAPVDDSPVTPALAQPDDHALSTTTFFPPSTSSTAPASNGFVLSRLVEDAYALELRWVAFARGPVAGTGDQDMGDGSADEGQQGQASPYADLDSHPGILPPVRFVFPSRLIPSPSFALSPEGTHLEVFAVSEAGYLYVLTFPLESLFYGDDLGSADAEDWSDEFKLESVEGRTPVLMQGVEDGRVIVACEDGFVACVDFAGEDGTLLETELKSAPSFSIRSLVPSFSSRNLASPTKGGFSATPSASPSQLISLSASSTPSSDDDLPSPAFAFGLSRDRKLKIWNLQNGIALPPIDLSKLVTSTSSALALASSASTDSPQASRTHGGVLLPSSPQSFLRSVPGTSSTAYPAFLAVFVPSSPTTAAAFAIYGLEVDVATGDLATLQPVAERACPPSLASTGSLVDFGVHRLDLQGESRWTLWSVWDYGGETDVRTIGVPELDAAGEANDEVWISVERGTTAKTAQWTASYFDEQLRDSALSVPEVFLRHISSPGRYPPATLDFALAEYEDLIRSEYEDEPEAFQLDFPTPLQRAAAVVGSTVVLEQSAQTGALLHDDYNKRLKLEWLRFVALLNESRAAALFPTHLAVDHTRGVAAVFGRDAVSVPVVREAVHALAELSLPDLQAAQQQLLTHPEAAGSLVDLPAAAGLGGAVEVTLRADVLPLLSAIRILESRLSPADSAALESAFLERLRSPLESEIEDVALELFEQALEGVLDDDALRETLAAVSALDSPDRAVDAFSRLLVAEQLPVLSSSAESQLPATDLATALVTDALATSLSARYSLAKGLVTLLVVVWAAEDDEAVEADVMGASDAAPGAAEKLFARLDQTTAAALTTLHGLAAAQWVASEIVVPEAEAVKAVQEELAGSEDADGIVARFGELGFAHSSGADVHPVPSFGLLNALLRLPGYAPALLPSSTAALPTALSQAVSFTARSLGLLPPPLSSLADGDDGAPATEVTAHLKAAVLAFRLLQVGLAERAAEFVELWPRSSVMEYVRGRAALKLGEGEVAREALERAASGLYAVELDDASDPSSSALSLLLPSSIDASLARFYMHLVALFVPTSFDLAVARFASLALEAIELEGELGQDEPAEKDLWIKLFRAYAATGEYEKAYETIMATPYHETQMTCLAHFISVLCENGATALLTQYSFAGLEADLERNLAFRARNSDPLAKPNYYRVLYAYHVSKGDYRSAGTVMYNQGRRLGELSTARGADFRELATLQCQSYLAATNALALVKKEHAWVAVVSGDEGERGNKRRKVTYQIPEDEFDPAVASRPLEVLELADIRKEYCVALARLQLADEFPELERTNFHLDPEAVVALFAQTGNFEQAFSSGRVLETDLSSLFEVVAERCVGLTLHPEGSQDASWVTLSDETATWEGSLSSKAWRLLERQLERHDSAPAYRYRLVVLERTLATNRGGKVPAFLSDFLAKHDVHSLLMTLIKYDRLDEAFTFSLAAAQNSSASTSSSFSTTLPYSLFDQLLAIPSGDSPNLSDDVLKQRQQELRTALQGRVEKVEKAQGQLRRA
ncbi:hypothetical protein JCM8097_006370 [Rhodosporidiobolus ruineniae]